jgi:hypothetical protein
MGARRFAQAGRKAGVTLGLAILTAMTGAVVTRADQPLSELRDGYAAPLGVLTLYKVNSAQAAAFTNAYVRGGPFARMVAGSANDRLLEPLPASTDGIYYISLSRYYATGVADFVEGKRSPSTRDVFDADPVQARLTLTLVEHAISDWAWEKRKNSAADAAVAGDVPQSKLTRLSPAQDTDVFTQGTAPKVGSLSYFKMGYVGQVGAVDIFSKDDGLDVVRAELDKRKNSLCGATIFKDQNGRFVVYSEYFRAPKDLAARRIGPALTDQTARGGQAGIVIQNYHPQ